MNSEVGRVNGAFVDMAMEYMNGGMSEKMQNLYNFFAETFGEEAVHRALINKVEEILTA